MNVQPMTLDLNSLRAPQQPSNQQMASKREDAFSSVLEKSRENQETASRPKANNEKEKTTQTSKEKPTTENALEAKKEVKKEEKTDATTESKTPDTEEVAKSKEAVLEDDVLTKAESDKVIQAMAGLLGITATDLEQMLETLQIGIADLLKGDNLQKLIMQVHGVEEPMDLLLIPEVSAQIKAVTSMLEEYTTNTAILAEPSRDLLDLAPQQVIEVGQQQSKTKPEAQGLTGTNQKAAEQAVQTNVDQAGVEADTSNIAKATVTSSNNEGLSQNEEQSTPNPNNQASQFLDTLSQSIGEVFQTQTNQVNETFETISTRNEIVNPRMILDQIVEKIKVTTLDNEAKMSIQLKPEHLGKLSMEVVSKQGVLTAYFTVENEKTKAMLDQNIQSLRESLENQGLVIQELEVTVGQNQNEDSQMYESQKSTKNISDMINRMMNEEIPESETQKVNLFENEENEVDFIA